MSEYIYIYICHDDYVKYTWYVKISVTKMTRQKMANSFLRSSRSHPAPSRTVGHILTWRGKRAANVAFPVTRFLSAVKITDEMTKRLKCIWHVSIRMTYMYDICPPLSLLALPMLSSTIAQWGNGSTTNQPAILNYPVWSCMNLNVNSLALMPLSSKSFIIADSITGCTPQAMLLPSLSSTVMLVTWRSSHQTKKPQVRKTRSSSDSIPL